MRFFLGLTGLILFFTTLAFGQAKTFPVSSDSSVEIINLNGKISVRSVEDSSSIVLNLKGTGGVKSESKRGRIRIESTGSERVDFEIEVPEFVELKLQTTNGQIATLGEFAYLKASTSTGTIYIDTEFENLEYKLLWTASYPRYMSDVPIGKIKEKNAGKFQISGFAQNTADSGKRREVELRTERGIILVNVSPSQVPSDLLPKKMTKAAEAILNSGDGPLVNAVLRAAPELVDEDFTFEQRRKSTPVLIKGNRRVAVDAQIKRVNVQVVDQFNRAVSGLEQSDFEIVERGQGREILKVETSDEPFNLLLLMDVSGSVRDYVDFIRKAGRSFVETVGKEDRISIVVFNDDVQVLSGFTSDRQQLSESLDSFDAGGGTALYDAIGYGLVESLRPLRGKRTGIVILSDGDDNRSFLSLDPLIGALQESGALVYPMYVPSSLIASSGSFKANDRLDPVRDKYLSNNLSSKAQREGKRLADVSGGVYFPIAKLSELERAYGDIVKQLRTSYTITFRSAPSTISAGSTLSRLRVRIKKEDVFVKLGPVSAVE